MKVLKKHIRIFFLLFFVSIQLGAMQDAGAQWLDIRRFGAVGDGKTNNTAAIQQAVDSCSLVGGAVYVPSGIFLSGTIVLKSNVTLHLSAGSTLLGEPTARFYPYQDAGIRFYGDEWAKQALLFCKGQTNVTIEGKGTIDGQGASFLTTTLKKPDRYRNRPYLLWFAGCENVTVTGVNLRNSAFWMQHYLGCRNVRIDGIRIWNHSNKNNDMIDIDGCSRVTIANVIGDSDDDGITIKSTSPLISEHIAISNCVLSSHCSAIKFGTESVGGFRNVTVSNCVIKPSAQEKTIYGKPAGISGLALEMVDGGNMEQIAVSNLVIDGPQVPVFIRLGNRARKYKTDAPQPKPGVMRDISISDIVAKGAGVTGCAISGVSKASIENVSLQNIRIDFAGGIAKGEIKNKVEDLDELYPEATMFGTLPAYGFYIRHVKGITISDVRLSVRAGDDRPPFLLDNVRDVAMIGISAPGHKEHALKEQSE